MEVLSGLLPFPRRGALPRLFPTDLFPYVRLHDRGPRGQDIVHTRANHDYRAALVHVVALSGDADLPIVLP